MSVRADTATRQRADGKLAKGRRVAWTLEMGGGAFRCVWSAPDIAVAEIEGREPRGWTKIGVRGSSPAELLRRLVATASVGKLLS